MVQFCQVNTESVWNTCQSYSIPRRARCSICFSGLSILACLWQREQDELLQEVIADSVAVMIKATGIGPVEKHLGKTLTEMQPTLMKLLRLLCNISGPRHG